MCLLYCLFTKSYKNMALEGGHQVQVFCPTTQQDFWEEGYLAFYRVFFAQLIQWTPNTAIMLPTYELIVYLLESHTQWQARKLCSRRVILEKSLEKNTGFQTFRVRMNYTTDILQLAKGKLWDSLVPITMWATSYNKFSFMYFSIYSIGFVSLEKSNTPRG